MEKEWYIQIRSKIKDLIRATEWEGHVFCVGGCVRDEIMGNEIKDIDLVVDLPNGGIRFADWMRGCGFTNGETVTYPTYGTAMFRLKDFSDIKLECVQTRGRKATEAKRRNPETAFGSLTEDCLLRDLTINSPYLNVTTDDLLDFTHKGIDDIRNHVVRTTTDPDIIFGDDPLRVLRCIRFATRYGWKIEPQTYDGMKRNAGRLNIVAKERVREELDKMLTGRCPVRAIRLLSEAGAMQYVIPELEDTYAMTQNQYHFGTVWEHTLKVLDNVKDDRLEVRMAALLHDIGKIATREETSEGKVRFLHHEAASADLVDVILRRLKYSNEFICKVRFLVQHHMDCKAWQDDLSMMKAKRLRKLQYECKTEERFKDLMLLVDADNKAHAENYCLEHQADLILQRTGQMKQEGSALFGYTLPFTGKEIMELKGLTPGPTVKECLEYLLKLAYVSPLRSKEEWTKHLLGYRVKNDLIDKEIFVQASAEPNLFELCRAQPKITK